MMEPSLVTWCRGPSLPLLQNISYIFFTISRASSPTLDPLPKLHAATSGTCRYTRMRNTDTSQFNEIAAHDPSQ